MCNYEYDYLAEHLCYVYECFNLTVSVLLLWPAYVSLLDPRFDKSFHCPRIYMYFQDDSPDADRFVIFNCLLCKEPVSVFLDCVFCYSKVIPKILLESSVVFRPLTCLMVYLSLIFSIVVIIEVYYYY